MKTTNPFKIEVFAIVLAALSFLTVTANLHAQGVTCQTNGVKYSQVPDPNGYDISDSLGYILADDFVCTNTGPITNIHLWGSWLGDTPGNITNFWIGIYSNVPASGNNGSHPGILLWSNSFPAGQFAQTPLQGSQEHFLTPASPTSVGADTEIWYYCFTPTTPFVQTGSSASPQIYWLAVYAQGQNFGPMYFQAPQWGWKTTPFPQHDISVYTFWPGLLPPSTVTWTPNTTSEGSGTGTPLDLSFELDTPTNTTTSPCCPDTNGVKYLQPPNVLNGIDVDAATIRGGTLADDFLCTNPGAISDIHLWGSWLSDQVDPNAIFTLSIWSDVPAMAGPVGPIPSHPGNMLWSQTFGPGNYFLCPYTNLPEAFDDPQYGPPPIPPPTLVPFGASTNLYYLCFYPAVPFVQQGTATAPTNYWLSVTESNPTGGGQFYFGWKTSSVHYNDAAVYTLNLSPPSWNPIVNADGGPYDLAFKINTFTNFTRPVICVETNGVKTIQGPNVTNGFDVWNTPYVLADDFKCTFEGPITDIHIWGSWLGDQSLPNTIVFWLGIYNDVPVGPNNPYSHPGTNVLWSQWFAPGQYAENIYTNNATEQFLDPGQTNILGTDSQVWYYCFYPTNPFEQLGTTSAPVTYWLAAYAQVPVGVPYEYGWKTTSKVANDTSVHAFWPSVPPTNNPGWTPTVYQPPAGGPPISLDLAFKLTTPTNICGGPKIVYLATNAEVLTWSSGFLQSATNVQGPYFDVPGATSPYTNTLVVPPYKFYRLRCY